MSTNTLKGFTPVAPTVRGAQVDKESLTDGVIVRYLGSRYVDQGKARGFRHTFKTRGGMTAGQSFEVWGTAELNDMLKKLRAGVIVFIRYGGKQPHGELSGAEIHKWDLRDSRHSEPTPELQEAIRDNADAQAALETIIGEARQRESERFEQRRAEAIQRGEAPPAHTDDDLPF